jgi:integrase
MPTNAVLETTKTPGVYRRGSRYVVRFRDPTGKQRKRFAATYKEALRLKSTLTADVHRGEFRATSKVTFADYAATWIATYQGRTRRGVGPRTLELYRQDLGLNDQGEATGKGAVWFFGRTQLSELGPAELKAYGKHLADRGHSRSTVKRGLAPVKALLATAHEDGLIRFNPAAGLRNLAPAKQEQEAAERVKAFTPEELAAVLEKIPAAWLPFFSFLAETGLRIGEAIEVRWCDVDRGKLTLNVARQYHRGDVVLPKGRKTRRIPISKRLDAMLWELRKQTKATDAELVFTAERGSRLDQKNLAARVLKPACVAAGVGEMAKDEKGGLRPESWASFHTFRHTCATQLFRTGWNAAQVSRFLGHSDAGFTLRTYVHLLDEDLPEPDVLGSIEASASAERRRENAEPDAHAANGDEEGERVLPPGLQALGVRGGGVASASDGDLGELAVDRPEAVLAVAAVGRDMVGLPLEVGVQPQRAAEGGCGDEEREGDTHGPIISGAAQVGKMGHTGATQAAETGRTANASDVAKVAV